MRLTVWNRYVTKPDGTLQPIVFEGATWILAEAQTVEGLVLVHVTHTIGDQKALTVMPVESVALLQEQPEPGDGQTPH